MSAPNKAHRCLNLVEIILRNKTEFGSVFAIWLLLSQKYFHLAVETELFLLHFAGGFKKNCIARFITPGAGQLTGLMTARISWSGF
jgi:hypothetical protein